MADKQAKLMTQCVTARLRERRLKLHQMYKLIRKLASTLNALHQVNMPERYWLGLLYWYVREGVNKRNEFLALAVHVHYDGSAVKSRILNRANKKNKRTFFKNLSDFQRFENFGKPWRRIRIVKSVLKEIPTYIIFRIVYWRQRSKLRQRLNHLATLENDPLIFQSLSLMPMHLVEDFAYFRRWQSAYEKPIDSRKLKNGLSIAIMNRLADGRPVDLIQHGAFYGESKYHDALILERRIADNFYTWGWSAPAGRQHCAAIPIRSEMQQKALPKLQLRYEVCLVMPSIFEPEVHSPILNYLVSSLNSVGVKPLIRIRPATIKNMGVSFLQPITSAGEVFLHHEPDVQFEGLLPECQVFCFIEHPSTAFLEAIRQNRPSLVLARDASEYTPRFRCHRQALIDLGIAYSTPKSLQKRLVQLYQKTSDATLESWWSSAVRDSRFKHFQLNYCRF